MNTLLGFFIYIFGGILAAFSGHYAEKFAKNPRTISWQISVIVIATTLILFIFLIHYLSN